MTIERWAMVEARTTCGKCGSPVPLAGPNRAPLCNACQNTLQMPPGLWKSILEDIDEDWNEVAPGNGQTSKLFTGGGEFNRNWYKVPARCAKCEVPFPAESIAAGADAKIHCPACGAASTTYPAPEWMRAVLPSAVQIVGGEREGGAASGEAAEVDRAAAQPIVMTCPQCGGALRITKEAARVTPCSFCSTDVYLPDDIWKRLHPVKVVAPWWIGLSGSGAKPPEPEPEPEEDDDDDHDDEHAHAHVDEPVVHHGGSSGFYWVITILGIVSALGYGGWHYFAGMWGGAPTNVSGQFQAMGPLLGSWLFTPTECAGGGLLGPGGAKLSGEGHFVLLSPEPTGVHVFAGSADGSMVDFGGCTGVQGQVAQVSGGFAGAVSLQCSDAAGNTLSGTATFNGCD